MSDVTPPAGIPPWVSAVIAVAVGLVTSAFGAVWARWRAADARLIGSLEAQVTARDATIKSLGDKLDAQRDQAKRELYEANRQRERVVVSMVRRLSAEQIQRFDGIEDEPSAVYRAVALAQAALAPPELSPRQERHLDRYAHTEGALSTPPEPPRRKLPSHRG